MVASSFHQIPMLTNIGATEHTKIFLNFVHFMWTIPNEHIYLPCNEGELRMVMKRCEEMGLPGAAGSVNLVHIK